MSFNAITYFEKVARKLKAIGHTDTEQHYFRIRSLSTLDELLNNLPSANFPALLVHDTIDGVIGDFSVSDNFADEPQFVFYILQKADFTDEASVDEAVQLCRSIGTKIIAQMLRHSSLAMHGLQFIDLSRIPYQSIGPLGDQCFGMMYMFNVLTHIELLTDPEDWDGSW